MADLNRNLKVLSVSAAGILQIPDDSSLPQELQHETVKAKLAQARLLGQKFPSLAAPPATASASAGTAATAPLVTVVNTDVEAMQKVGAVPGSVFTLVAVLMDGGSRLLLQNPSSTDALDVPAGMDLCSCGNMQLHVEEPENTSSLPSHIWQVSASKPFSGESAVFVMPSDNNGFRKCYGLSGPSEFDQHFLSIRIHVCICVCLFTVELKSVHAMPQPTRMSQM